MGIKVSLLAAIAVFQSLYYAPSLAQTSQQKPGAMTSPTIRPGHSPICPQDMVATKVSGLSPAYYPNLSQDYINKANSIAIPAFGSKYVCINFYGQISSAYWRQSSNERCRDGFIQGSKDLFYYCVKPGENWGKSTAQMEDFDELASAFKTLTSALRGTSTPDTQTNSSQEQGIGENKEIGRMQVFNKHILCSPTSGLKKKEDVIQQCNDLVATLPNNSEAYLQRGSTLNSLFNDKKSACLDFKRAVDLDSDQKTKSRADSEYKKYCQGGINTRAQIPVNIQKSQCMSTFMDRYMKGQISREQSRLEFMKCQSIQ